MNRPTLHVCIATGQNLANLIPALQLAATEVAIVETAEMRPSARNLELALRARGIRVRRLPFDDATPEAIAKAAGEIATRLGENPLVFNATGGHKLLVLALTENFAMADELHVVYAETRADRLDWLKPAPMTEPMADVLALEDILLAQGYRTKSNGMRDAHWMNDAAARERLTRRMGDGADKLAGLFGALNALADQALNEDGRGGPFRPQQALLYAPGGASAKVLREAHALGLLHWDGATQVVFANPEAARYFRGGWLEEYVWVKLRGLKPRDAAVNLQIETAAGGVLNELDAVVVHRNRLLAIECKTARLGRDRAEDAQYIYKLAHLSRQVGGIMSRALLLSARPVSDDARTRARESGADVLAAAEVRNLVPYLRNWMAPARSAG